MRTLLAGVLLLLSVTAATAADWPQWLGPNRDGVWTEDGILDKFPEGGPKVLWRKEINGGYTGPAVAGGRVYVMDRVRGEKSIERVLCLDHKTGDKVWTHEYERAYKGVDRPMGPRTTPVVDGERLYTLGTMGDLYCLNLKTGEPVWKKYLPDDYKTKPPVWGYSNHLLVHGDLVISLVGGEGKGVVAFDKATGAEKWAALTSEDVGYSPPVIAKVGQTEQLIVWLSDVLAGLNPKTGEVYWKEPHPEKGKTQMKPTVTIITPKIVGNVVYVSSGYDGGLAVKLGEKTAEVLWRTNDNAPKAPLKMPILMTTIIAKKDHLYSLNSDSGAVVCTEAATGKEVWRSEDLFGKKALFGSAFWVEQGDRVFCFSDAGDLAILNLNPKKYEEVDRAHILDPIGVDRGRKVIWAHPAFAGKTIVVRNEKEIVCVSLAKG